MTKVTSNFHNSSKYSLQSQALFNLDGLYSSLYFQVLASLYQCTGDCTEHTNYKVTFKFNRFFISLARCMYLSLFSFYFSFTLRSAGTAKSSFFSFFFFFFFLLTITRSGRLAEIRSLVFISKSQIILCVSFSRTDSGFCIFQLFLWSTLNFFHYSQWITFPTKSYLVLYSF